MTPDWKRPLTCAIFLPGSSAKKQNSSNASPGAGARWSFSLCRNDPKEKGRRSPRSPDRLGEPGTPPRSWAGEIPRPALPAPLLRGRATPQLCARELLAAPAPPPGPPPAAAGPFVGERGWGAAGSARHPGRGLASPGTDSPASEPWIPQVGPAALPLARPRVPVRQLRSPGETVPLRLRVRPCPGPGKPPRARLPERGASGHLTARPVNQR